MRLTLLQRTAISASGLALLVSALLGVGAMVALELQERAIERAALESGVQELLAHVRAGGWPDLRNDDRTISAVAQAPAFAVVSPLLRAYPPGLTEIESGPLADFALLVRDIEGHRYYFGMNMRAPERQERDFVAVGGLLVVLALLLSTGFGWLYALQQLRPLRALSERVAALHGNSDGSPVSNPEQPHELDQIAAAIDGYRQRLADAQAQQSAFLADISHELRTPVAVLQSGVELLCARQATPDSLHQRLLRNVTELSLRLDALMLSARPSSAVSEYARSVRAEVEAAISTARARQHSTLSLDIDPAWQAPIRPQVLRWVVVQLVEALAPSGLIELSGAAPTLSIISPDCQTTSPLSAVLINVCERENWRLKTVVGGFALTLER